MCWCCLQVVLAVLARRASWQLEHPNEGWYEFPLAVPKKGMAMRLTPVEQ